MCVREVVGNMYVRERERGEGNSVCMCMYEREGGVCVREKLMGDGPVWCGFGQ